MTAAAAVANSFSISSATTALDNNMVFDVISYLFLFSLICFYDILIDFQLHIIIQPVYKSIYNWLAA